jgi:hypothetical protein
MAVSVVNGYFCANSCDAAKAKKGQDPHPSTDPGSVDGNDRSSPRADDPAVVFGGSLSSTLQAQAIQSQAVQSQAVRSQAVRSQAVRSQAVRSQAVAAAGGAQPDAPAAAPRPGISVDILA